MPQAERETLDVDILFVGAGPSSLSGAIYLAQLIESHNKDAEKHGHAPLEMPTIAVMEKGPEVGAHQISGAVLDPSSLQELFPDFLDQGCPVESEVTEENVYFLTKTKAFRFPILPPQLHNKGNYVISLSKFTRWLGEKATELGINIFTGFAATKVLYEDKRVVGVATGDKGLDSKGKPKQNYEAGVNIRAKCTIFGEGVRGFLSKQLIPKLGLDQGKHLHTFETGVKEIWECPKGRVKPGMVIHTLGYPLSRKTVGGSFVYGMKNEQLVIGLVVSLNYSDPFLEPYKELQKLKQTPLISRFIEGGKSVAYGAKAIASGGYYAIPKLCFDGGMIIGESGQLLDMPRLKGIHIGMKSGMLASQAIFETLKEKKKFSQKDLESYPDALFKSKVGKELHQGRNFHQALSRGLPQAFIHLAAQQITSGRGFIDPMPTKLDRYHYKTVTQAHGKKEAKIPDLEDQTHVVDKLTSVYNSGTLHDENQVCHLKIADFNQCYSECVEEYRSPCNRFCPANVYEMLKESGKWRLQLNFTNCVHCQTCDIKCPKDNILWTPPEGGGGPHYSIL